MENRSISKLFIIVLLGFVVLLFWLFWAYLSSIILAFLIASVFYPLYWRLKKVFKNRENTAALFMSLFVMVILIIPVGGFIGTLSNEGFDFYNRTRSSVSLVKIQEWIEGDTIWAQRVRRVSELANIQLNSESLQDLASSVGKNVGLYLSKQISPVASNLLNFLVHFFLMILIIYYIFKDGMRLKDYLSELLPFPLEQQELVAHTFREMGRAVIIGNGLSGVIQGVIGGFGFYAFGLGSPFLWGTVIAFMAFLPIIGASIIFIPATIIIMIQGKTGAALGFFIYSLLYSSIVEYFVKPRLIGKSMRMNPILVFLGILGGLKLFGILGIVYGPLIMTIFFTLAEIYRLEYKETITL